MSDQQPPPPYGQPRHQPQHQPQYVAPVQGAPQQPAQGYPPTAFAQHPAQGYAPSGALMPPATGVRHWAWQLLYWVPIPLLPQLIVPVVLLALRPRAVRSGGVDEGNSRAAVNWSLTWLVAVAVTAVVHFGLLAALTGGGGSVAGDSPLGGVLATTATLLGLAYFGGGVLTLISVIRGWSAAGRGEIAKPWLGIPFLRAPRG